VLVDPDDDPTALQECVTWLADRARGWDKGCMASSRIKQEALIAGHTVRTLQRARIALGLIVRSHGVRLENGRWHRRTFWAKPFSWGRRQAVALARPTRTRENARADLEADLATVVKGRHSDFRSDWCSDCLVLSPGEFGCRAHVVRGVALRYPDFVIPDQVVPSDEIEPIDGSVEADDGPPDMLRDYVLGGHADEHQGQQIFWRKASVDTFRCSACGAERGGHECQCGAWVTSGEGIRYRELCSRCRGQRFYIGSGLVPAA